MQQASLEGGCSRGRLRVEGVAGRPGARHSLPASSPRAQNGEEREVWEVPRFLGSPGLGLPSLGVQVPASPELPGPRASRCPGLPCLVLSVLGAPPAVRGLSPLLSCGGRRLRCPLSPFPSVAFPGRGASEEEVPGEGHAAGVGHRWA